MKKFLAFFKKNVNYVIFILAFVVILAGGILFNSAITKEKVYYSELNEIRNLLNGVEVTSYELTNQKFFLPAENGTKITKRYNAYNGKELVGIVYVGTTKGYKEGLEVAIGIDVKKDFIVGAKIVNSNETQMFLDLLVKKDFFKQFKKKDMSYFNIEFQFVTGATPINGGQGTIAPFTSEGIQKVMLMARKQYASDTDFVMPVGLTLVSKSVDFENINQFKYVLKFVDKEINVVVNKNYEIVSIDDESQKTAAQDFIKKNPMTDYIDSVTTEGNVTTLVIKTAAYSGSVATTTVTITDGSVTDVKIVYSQEQTYDMNDEYNNGKDSDKTYDNAAQDILNNIDIYMITGATVTGNALRNAQNILRGYMEAHHE